MHTAYIVTTFIVMLVMGLMWSSANGQNLMLKMVFLGLALMSFAMAISSYPITVPVLVVSALAYTLIGAIWSSKVGINLAIKIAALVMAGYSAFLIIAMI